MAARKRRRKGKARKSPARRRKGVKRRRTPAQKRATLRMIAARKRSLR
jgi:hypothetical protein